MYPLGNIIDFFYIMVVFRYRTCCRIMSFPRQDAADPNKIQGRQANRKADGHRQSQAMEPFFIVPPAFGQIMLKIIMDQSIISIAVFRYKPQISVKLFRHCKIKPFHLA